MIFPPFFRFPFMSPHDLQIGLTFTEPAYRGQELALLAIREIVHRLAMPDRRFWYLVEEENQASIRVIEKAGFQCVGRGVKLPRFGLKFLGYYAFTPHNYPLMQRPPQEK